MFFIVFFFKQKPAYELRISDWSSYVCSSDLRGAPGWRASTSRHLRPSCAQSKVIVPPTWRRTDLLSSSQPNPPRPAGGVIALLVVSCQSSTRRLPSSRQVTSSEPSTPSRAPYLAALVAGSCRARSEERRGGKECVSTGTSGWWRYHEKKK